MLVWLGASHLEIISYHAWHCVATGSCSSFLRILIIFSFWSLRADLLHAVWIATFEHENIHNLWLIFFFFFFAYCLPCFLQRETRGPPQPLRQRAPPAKMPREVEAHPKLSQRPKGGRAEEWNVERKQVKVERHGERKGRVYIGCPSWTWGHLRSLPACLELQRPKCTPFHWIRL